MNRNIRTILLGICFCFSAIISYSQIITTIAGNGTASFTGDGTPATSATMNVPCAVCADGSGNLYIADYSNNRVRKVDASGIITTIAGNGVAGFGGDGGAATAAALHNPIGVAIDATGNLFIADNLNNRVRKVNTSGIISTYAGNGTGAATGDGGPATLAALSSPNRIAVDNLGNLYIPDYLNNKIRKVTTGGIITTVAGNGSAGISGDGAAATAAQLHGPSSVAVDGSGNIFITDFTNNRIRKVNTSGIISTYAGTGIGGFSGDSGPASAAQFNGPIGMCIDGSGNIYVSDYNNQRVRRITASGTISTFAGNGTVGFSGDGSAATAAQLHSPSGLGTDGNCNLYISDNANNRVRIVPLYAPFTAGTITGPSRVCIGSSISLSNATTGGVWSSSASSIAPVSGTGTVNGVSVGTARISYTTTNGCVSQSAIRVVTVDATASAGTISGTLVICPAATSLLASTEVGGTWSSGATAIATVASTGNVTGVSGGTAVITYTFTNGCGTASTTKIMTVNPLPNAGTITGSATGCPGVTTLLTDASPGGAWSSAATTIVNVGSTGLITGIASGTALISYTVTNGCGSSFATRTFTVNSLPVSGTITGASTICIGVFSAFTGSVTGGVWGTTNSNAVITGTGGAYGITTGIDTIKYSVTNICGTATTSVSVTVQPVPDAGAILGASSLCPGTAMTLSTTGTGGVWSTTNGTATVSAGGVVNGVSAGIDTIKYAVTNSCGTENSIHVVTVNQLPNAGTITGPDSVCSGSIINLTNTTTGGYWLTGEGNAFVSSTGGVFGITGGNAIISYIISNACGKDTATKTITVINCSTGVGDVSGSNIHFNISPNPTTGIFTVQSPTSATLMLYGIEGRKVESYKITRGANAILIPPTMAAGIYVGVFNGDDGSTIMVRLVYRP